MYDVLNVADALLKIAKADNIQLTPLQLVKLCYIAHGWSLGVRDCPLFSNRIEAWQYGPVIPDLYHVTKHYKGSPIPWKDVGDVDQFFIQTDDVEFLRDVFESYKPLDGIALSYLTHQAGTPWSQVYRPHQRHIEIPNNLIATHYKELRKNGGKASR